MALTIANKKKKNPILRTIQRAPWPKNGMYSIHACGSGDNHPPKNNIVVSAHINHIAMYSPAMNSKNGVDEYSTW